MNDIKYEDTPITNWFKIKNKDHVLSPKYFYYDHLKDNIIFSVERPKNCYNIGTVRWTKYNTMLNICCNKKTWKFANKNNDKINFFRNLAFNNYNRDQIPILKSNLQKCVRRSLVEPSISTALTLLCLDSSQLLRRLPIIMLEDVILNNDILLLIWLMCANSKGFPINDELMLRIINIVHFLASSNIRDSYEKLDTINIKKFKLNELGLKERNILWALQLRCSYGGMFGDMKMINYLTKCWYERFNEKFILDNNPNILKIEDLRLLRFNDIHISSVDFHCTNILICIKNKYSKYNVDEIKKAIWYNRSSLNNKSLIKDHKSLNDQYLDVWQDISKYVNYISKMILKNLFYSFTYK
jgi:hypothetical protein